MAACDVDVAVFGGGVAGLWLLDALTRSGRRAVLLEAGALGSGQTVASQGIIHGGLKYTLDGLFNRSADAIRAMPDLWRACLAGTAHPTLTNTRVRAEYCHLWRTDTLRSRLGMVGARQGLQVRPERLAAGDRPEVLRSCPGDVFRLSEPVICPQSMIADLAGQHRARCLKFDLDGLRFARDGQGDVAAIDLEDRWTGQRLTIRPRSVVLAAGRGNVDLRGRLGLAADRGQERPLQMVLVRGGLPVLNGHCVDGAKTRVTITTATDAAGATVWQVGGQVAEDGVGQDPAELIGHARRELEACLPGMKWDGLAWGTYVVSRAEARTAGARRPENEVVLRDGNVWTAWPTKLALAPRMANRIVEELPPVPDLAAEDPGLLDGWARPAVADPPWEEQQAWHHES